MKNLFFLLALFLTTFYSCQKDDKGKVPSCIQEMMDHPDTNSPIKFIKWIKKEGVEYFWLNTGAVEYDGAKYVLSRSCDTLCYFCGQCQPPRCEAEYFDEWTPFGKSEYPSTILKIMH